MLLIGLLMINQTGLNCVKFRFSLIWVLSFWIKKSFVYHTNNTTDMNISPITFLALFLLTACLSSPNPKGRQNKERSNGSCSREKCAEGRSSLKISSECVRAPFCVRQVMRELKKVSREKVRNMKKHFILYS